MTSTRTRIAASFLLAGTAFAWFASTAGAASGYDGTLNLPTITQTHIDGNHIDVAGTFHAGTGTWDILTFTVPNPADWDTQVPLQTITIDTASGDVTVDYTGANALAVPADACAQVDIVQAGNDQPYSADIRQDCTFTPAATPTPVTATPTVETTATPVDTTILTTTTPAIDQATVETATATLSPVVPNAPPADETSVYEATSLTAVRTPRTLAVTGANTTGILGAVGLGVLFLGLILTYAGTMTYRTRNLV